MPIYEYRCKHCGHELDVLQKLSEPPVLCCPACNQDALQRMVSAPRFRLKGAGWYETDFKKDNRRNLVDGSDKPAEPKTAGSGSETKAEKKEAGASKPDKPAPKTE